MAAPEEVRFRPPRLSLFALTGAGRCALRQAGSDAWLRLDLAPQLGLNLLSAALPAGFLAWAPLTPLGRALGLLGLLAVLATVGVSRRARLIERLRARLLAAGCASPELRAGPFG